QQSVDPSQVDECSEVGDVLDRALADLADLDLLEELLLLLFAGDLDQFAAALVNLQDHALDVLIDISGNIGRPMDVDLACRQEDVHADIDEQTALDLASDASLDDVAFMILGDHHLPGAHPMGLLAGEDDLAGIVFHPLEQDLDGLARLRMRFVFPLAKGHQTLGFVADIDDDLVTHHFHDLARDDGADLEALSLAQEMVESLAAILRS